MKNITLNVLIGLAGVFSAASALAQSDPLIANVPFAFSVDNKVLPAGRYEVEQISSDQIPGGIVVRNLDHSQYSAMTIGDVNSWEGAPLSKAVKAQLIFDNLSGKYFLHQVQGPIDTLNIEFPVTKSEKTAENGAVASNATHTTIVAGE